KWYMAGSGWLDENGYVEHGEDVRNYDRHVWPLAFEHHIDNARHRRDFEALRAARERAPIEGGDSNHLAGCQRREDKKRATQTRAHLRQQRACASCDQGTCKHSKPRWHAIIQQQNRRRVRANPEEGSMAERNEARINPPPISPAAAKPAKISVRIMMSPASGLLKKPAATMQEARTTISMIDTEPRRGAAEKDMACIPSAPGIRPAPITR